VPPAIVDRVFRWRKAWIGKGTHGDGHGIVSAFFCVEHVRSAYGAEPESEPRPLISGAYILRSRARDSVRRREGGQSSKDAAGSALTGEAVTNADAARFTAYFNAQLSASARGCSMRHGAP